MGLDMFLYGVNSDNTSSEVAYWRKANAIHGWFVNNVQNGVDECQESPVTRGQLHLLLEVCQKIQDEVIMIPGLVKNGSTFKDGQWIDDFEPGQIVSNPEVCQQLLPCVGGFFFGSYEYDEYYMSDIQDTIERLEKALELEFRAFVYQSSW